MLIQELAGGVIILDREPGASHAIILGRLLDQGQCGFDGDLAKIADADLDRIGRDNLGGCQHAQADHANEQSDHDSSLIRRRLNRRGISDLKQDRFILRYNQHCVVALRES
jgi:hypothetical protein